MSKIVAVDLVETHSLMRKKSKNFRGDVSVNYETSYSLPKGSDADGLYRMFSRLQLKFHDDESQEADEAAESKLDAEILVRYQITVREYRDDDTGQIMRIVWPYLRTAAITQTRMIGLVFGADKLPLSIDEMRRNQ